MACLVASNTEEFVIINVNTGAHLYKSPRFRLALVLLDISSEYIVGLFNTLQLVVCTIATKEVREFSTKTVPRTMCFPTPNRVLLGHTDGAIVLLKLDKLQQTQTWTSTDPHASPPDETTAGDTAMSILSPRRHGRSVRVIREPRDMNTDNSIRMLAMLDNYFVCFQDQALSLFMVWGNTKYNKTPITTTDHPTAFGVPIVLKKTIHLMVS